MGCFLQLSIDQSTSLSKDITEYRGFLIFRLDNLKIEMFHPFLDEMFLFWMNESSFLNRNHRITAGESFVLAKLGCCIGDQDGIHRRFVFTFNGKNLVSIFFNCWKGGILVTQKKIKLERGEFFCSCFDLHFKDFEDARKNRTLSLDYIVHYKVVTFV